MTIKLKYKFLFWESGETHVRILIKRDIEYFMLSMDYPWKILEILAYNIPKNKQTILYS